MCLGPLGIIGPVVLSFDLMTTLPRRPTSSQPLLPSASPLATKVETAAFFFKLFPTTWLASTATLRHPVECLRPFHDKTEAIWCVYRSRALMKNDSCANIVTAHSHLFLALTNAPRMHLLGKVSGR